MVASAKFYEQLIIINLCISTKLCCGGGWRWKNKIAGEEVIEFIG